MLTYSNNVVVFELRTDMHPGETSWLLVDNDKDGAIVHSVLEVVEDHMMHVVRTNSRGL
jgi:hypothetical protein